MIIQIFEINWLPMAAIRVQLPIATLLDFISQPFTSN